MKYLILTALPVALTQPLCAEPAAEILRPTNAFGRDSLCLPGLVETRRGCVAEDLPAAFPRLSAQMQACLAAGPRSTARSMANSMASRSEAGYRARHAACRAELAAARIAKTNP